MKPRPRRPLRLTLPLTVVPGDGLVRLVGGEDLRFTLRAPGIERWAQALVDALAAGALEEAALARVPAEARADAAELVALLVGERLLVDVDEAPSSWPSLCIEVHGDEPLAGLVRGACQAGSGRRAVVLCQRTLDVGAAAAASSRARADGAPFVWVSAGPQSRVLVGPVLLPSGGPCLTCLLTSFRRRSPMPELYDELEAHGARGGAFAMATPGDHLMQIAAHVAAAKLEGLASPLPPSSCFALHVVEAAALSVESYPVFRLDDCPACGDEAPR